MFNLHKITIVDYLSEETFINQHIFIMLLCNKNVKIFFKTGISTQLIVRAIHYLFDLNNSKWCKFYFFLYY